MGLIKKICKFIILGNTYDGDKSFCEYNGTSSLRLYLMNNK